MKTIEYIKQSSYWYPNPTADFDLEKDKWGILFLNMGGPEDSSGVEPYLQNIFSDPDIIQLPFSFLMQKPLAKKIAAKRAPMVIERYNMIGGGSPLIKWSRLVAEGVDRELKGQFPSVKSAIGMRYTPPFIDDSLDGLYNDGCRYILVFPFYPHYSKVTTGTALKQVAKWFSQKSDCRLGVIFDWYTNGDYITLMRRYIDKIVSNFDVNDKTRVLFSAHAVPVKLVKQGDPYVKQVDKMASMIGQGLKFFLSYQSRTGPVEWVGPDTIDVTKKLGGEGVKNLVVVPISFVSDHIETLYELDIELKEIARKAGIENFQRVPALNDDPEFISILANMITERVAPQKTSV